jgi:hypothetical protein
MVVDAARLRQRDRLSGRLLPRFGRRAEAPVS